ncbi:MAG: glycerophosphodiester phosphodiesterase [Gemmatimonadaceae bacterium]
MKDNRAITDAARPTAPHSNSPGTTCAPSPGILPALVAHMGVLSGTHRPNTLAAIRECFAESVGRIEIDIHSLAGDDFIVTHDRRLEAATTGKGSIGALTPDDVRAVRFRHDGNDRPALLSEVATLAADARTEIQLDLKDWRPMTRERIDALLRVVAPAHDRVIVSTGQDWNLRLVHDADASLPIGFDPGLYIDRKSDEASVFLPRAIGAYGYRDDHPLAFGATETPAAYLEARMRVLALQAPGAREWFVNYRFVLQALEDGFDLTAWLGERGIGTNVWTLDHTHDRAIESFARLTTLGIARVTTNTTPAWQRALSATA